MEPTDREKQSQEACQLIVWLSERLELKVPEYARSGSKSIYGSRLNGLDYLAQRLCSLCEKAGDEIIYADARDPEMRRVATWWEDHQEQDRLKAERAKNDEHKSLLSRAYRTIALLDDEDIAQITQLAIKLRTEPKKPTGDKATDPAG